MDKLCPQVVLSQDIGVIALTAGALMGLGIAATLRGEPEQAKPMLKESLAIDVELGNMIDVVEDLECMAEAAGALDQHLRAARLWGTAAALREVIGVPWRPAERLLHAPLLDIARSRLEEAVWEEAFAEGQGMGLEEASSMPSPKRSPQHLCPPRPNNRVVSNQPRSAGARRRSRSSWHADLPTARSPLN